VTFRRVLFLLLLAGLPIGLAALPRFARAAEPVRLAGRADRPPYCFRDDAGRPRGILVDLWRLWSEETGREIRFVLLSDEAPEAAVLDGRADAAMGVPETPEANPALRYSRPVATRELRVFARPRIGDIRTTAALTPFRVGAVAGGPAAVFLGRAEPEIGIRTYPDLPALIAAALDGEIAVFAADASETLFALGRIGAGRRMVMTALAIPAVDLRAAMRRDRPELPAAVDEGFARIAPARRRAAVRAWSGGAVGHRVPWPLISAGTLLLILLGGAIAAWAWNDQLRREVHAATADLREKQRQLLRSEVQLRDSRRRYKVLYDRAKNDKELYRSLLASSADAILIADETGRVRYVNASFAELFGWTLDELRDRPMPFSGNGDARDHERMMAALREGDGILRGADAVRRDRNGEAVAVSVAASRYADHAGRFAGTLWILRDIRETRRLEAELRQSQKMEAIGTLAGGIAHDFNNILSAIMGFADLARMRIEDPEKVSGYLERILEATRRARDLVRQILAFTRQSEQALAPTAIGPLVKETLGLLRATFPAHIRIESRVEPDPGSANADPTQIHQVLMNLCTNARQAMGEERSGTLTVALEAVHAGPEGPAEAPELAPGEYLRLTVADTGPGIDPTIRHRIFDPYFTTKGPGEGTGLGLSVVHGIVRRHGGDIRVMDRPGGGTVFRVYLPRIPAEDRRDRNGRADAPARGAERILIVDDEPSLAAVGREILGAAGYRVAALTDSREALRVFERAPERFDLVLTDMTMPGMSGAELARRILRVRPEMPIFLCTGFSGAMTPERAEAMGIRAFFMKPLDYAAVAETIRSIFDGVPETEVVDPACRFGVRAPRRIEAPR
jgi:PAS domain S-box-containing protein